jgi:hypothetical protein
VPSSRRSRRRPYGAGHPELDLDGALRGMPRSEGRADGSTWTVRRVAGGDKSYRCPGCDQLIPPGTAHVVVVENDPLLGVEAAIADRRHWHSGCWQARDRRLR